MNILISTKTLALPSVSIYKIVNNDHGSPYFSKRMMWLPTSNFHWWLCQKIHHGETSNKRKLTYNDEWFVILFCAIKAAQFTCFFLPRAGVTLNRLVIFHVRSISHRLAALPQPPSGCGGAFETSVNIDFIYLIDTAHADTGTLHKQWCNGLETPHDQQQRGGE